MCNRVLLLFGKMSQRNLYVNCHVNSMRFQSGLRFHTGLNSLRVLCKRALTLSKKRFRNRWFICELCKISHNVFLKEPFGRLLLHKHSFCLLSRHDASSFQKRCYTYFLAEYFLGLIYRLVTRVSSIFQTLSQKLIFNPVVHLHWRFFVKIVNIFKYFCKKAPL